VYGETVGTSELFVHFRTQRMCITADKAQAGGALPVTTKVGALDERVKYGTMLDVKDIYTNEEAQKEFIEIFGKLPS